MTTPDEVDLLALWLLGALGETEAQAVRARVSEGVPATLAALDEARRVVGEMARGTPDGGASPELRARLHAAVAARGGDPTAPDLRSAGSAVRGARGGAAGPGGAPRSRFRWVVPGLIGASFLLVAVLNVWQGVRPQALTAEEARFGRLLLDARTERWVFKDPVTGEERGLAIRDADSRRGWLSLKGLPTAGSGRSYVLFTVALGEGRVPENHGAVAVQRDRLIDLELPASIELRDVASLVVSLETDPRATVPGDVKALAKSPRP